MSRWHVQQCGLNRLIRSVVLLIAVQVSVAGCSPLGRLQMVNNDGEFIDYAGELTISGAYLVDPGNIEMDGLVCFLPDEPSQKRFPQDSDANPRHWMCFSNNADARSLLELNAPEASDSTCQAGTATITAKNYRRYIAESEGISLSEITDVHRHDAASVVPCDTIHSW